MSAVLLPWFVQAEIPGVVAVGDLRASILRVLPLIERSAAQTLEARSCFTCHHGADASIVVNEAWGRGFPLKRGGLENQLARAYTELVADQARFQLGFSVSGTVDGPGHILWMLNVAGWQPDEITAGAVGYFIRQQEKMGSWETASKRPPTVGSPFTATFLIMRALQQYGQGEPVNRSLVRAEEWLLATPANDTEDRVYRLRSLYLLGNKPEVFQAELKELLQAQREDGGWAQTANFDSDAYATGTVLAALRDTDAIPAGGAAHQNGLRYLLSTQRKDGTWHVQKRTRSVQPMFDSGFPYGEDQFISYSATCWATYAMLKSLPLDRKAARASFLQQHAPTVSRLRTIVVHKTSVK